MKFNIISRKPWIRPNGNALLETDEIFYDHVLSCGHHLIIRNAPPAYLLEKSLTSRGSAHFLESSFVPPDTMEAECPLCTSAGMQY